MEPKPTEGTALHPQKDERRCCEEHQWWLDTTLVIVYFVVSSTGIVVFNKLLSSAFPLPMTVMTIQMIFSAVSFLVPPVLFWHNFGKPGEALRWSLYMPLLYVAQLSSSQLSMERSSLGAQAVFRSTTPLMTLAAESVIGERVVVTQMTLWALIFIVAVSLLFFGADNGKSTSALGVFWNLVQNVVVVTARLLERRFLVHEKGDLSISSALLLNSAIGAPIEALIALSVKEPWKWQYLYEIEPLTCLFLGLSCVCAVGISFSALLLTKCTTATTKPRLSSPTFPRASPSSLACLF